MKKKYQEPACKVCVFAPKSRMFASSNVGVGSTPQSSFDSKSDEQDDEFDW